MDDSSHVPRIILDKTAKWSFESLACDTARRNLLRLGFHDHSGSLGVYVIGVYVMGEGVHEEFLPMQSKIDKRI